MYDTVSRVSGIDIFKRSFFGTCKYEYLVKEYLVKEIYACGDTMHSAWGLEGLNVHANVFLGSIASPVLHRLPC